MLTNQILVETKKDYAKEMVTGFIRLNGMTVGVVANRSKVYNAEAEVEAEFDSVLTVDGCKKATDFVNFCDAFSIPGSYTDKCNRICCYSRVREEHGKRSCKLTCAFANCYSTEGKCNCW